MYSCVPPAVNDCAVDPALNLQYNEGGILAVNWVLLNEPTAIWASRKLCAGLNKGLIGVCGYFKPPIEKLIDEIFGLKLLNFPCKLLSVTEFWANLVKIDFTLEVISK